MTLEPAPQAIAAGKARHAAARARAYRQRAKEALVIDAAITDALAASLARIRRGQGIEAFVADLAGEATSRLRLAGVQRPGQVFRSRVDTAWSSAGSGPNAA